MKIKIFFANILQNQKILLINVLEIILIVFGVLSDQPRTSIQDTEAQELKNKYKKNQMYFLIRIFYYYHSGLCITFKSCPVNILYKLIYLSFS